MWQVCSSNRETPQSIGNPERDHFSAGSRTAARHRARLVPIRSYSPPSWRQMDSRQPCGRSIQEHIDRLMRADRPRARRRENVPRCSRRNGRQACEPAATFIAIAAADSFAVAPGRGSIAQKSSRVCALLALNRITLPSGDQLCAALMPSTRRPRKQGRGSERAHPVQWRNGRAVDRGYDKRC